MNLKYEEKKQLNKDENNHKTKLNNANRIKKKYRVTPIIIQN